MSNELIVQILGLLVTFIGLLFIWYQIKRSRQDSMLSSFIASLTERTIILEESRRKSKVIELEGFYKFLIPGLANILETEYANNLQAFSDKFIFNETEKNINNKDKILHTLANEYVDIDALYNLFEEQFVVGMHLNLVNKQLWKYWEFHIKTTFSSEKMRNYWTLRTNFKTIYPPFYRYVEELLKNPPDYDKLISK